MFWVGLVNRMHGLAWPEGLLRSLTIGCILAWMLGIGVWIGLAVLPDPNGQPQALLGLGKFERLGTAGQGYVLFCWLVAAVTVWRWLWRHVLHRPPKLLVSQTVESIPLPPPILADPEHHPMVRLPKNEILTLRLVRRHLALPHFPGELEGLTVLHLSDLHFTGRVAQAWFREILCFCGELQPDLVAVTGDFLDTMDCLDWIDEVLPPLQGRLGVYFVLGNHDWRLDERKIRDHISRTGAVSLGGRWVEREVPIRKEPSALQKAESPSSLPKGETGVGRILLAGNELPWMGPAPNMASAPPPLSEGGPVRILLAHSPDQFRWARKNHFDLMLAGHTHGGQVRIPGIGPILTPSRMGIRYSGGVFHEPPTVLHVSRGISAEWPLRWNCPPEVTLLVLHPLSGSEKGGDQVQSLSLSKA